VLVTFVTILELGHEKLWTASCQL